MRGLFSTEIIPAILGYCKLNLHLVEDEDGRELDVFLLRCKSFAEVMRSMSPYCCCNVQVVVLIDVGLALSMTWQIFITMIWSYPSSTGINITELAVR